jgi:hypothetical protein
MRRQIAAVVFASFLVQSAASAAMLDQSYDPGPNSGGYFVSSASTYAQLFEAGISGSVDSIDVRVYNYFGGATAPLDLELWTISGAYPELLSSSLATASVSHLSIPSSSGFVSFDLSSSGASFTAGQKYAVVLSTTSNNSYLWEGPSNGTYANGSGRQVSSGHVYYTLAGQDLDFGFKTYVVPEPASLALAAIGLMASMFVARRKATHS